MKLVGAGYIFETNVIFGFCTRCCELRSGKLSTDMKISCSCGPTVFEKPPLHFLINQGLPMIIYKLHHINTGKEFIGVIVTPETNRPEKKVDEEVKYIRDFRTWNIDPKLKKDLKSYGVGDFTTEVLSMPKSLSAAMIDEKLYINHYKTMAPNGYNKVCMVESLIKKARS